MLNVGCSIVVCNRRGRTIRWPGSVAGLRMVGLDHALCSSIHAIERERAFMLGRDGNGLANRGIGWSMPRYICSRLGLSGPFNLGDGFAERLRNDSPYRLSDFHVR